MRLSVNENSVINLDYSFIKNLNRYPDQSDFLKKLAQYLNVKEENLILGCGSSQLINLSISTFLNENDVALIPRPSFGLYSFCTENRNGVPKFLDLKNYSYDVNDYLNEIKKVNPKVTIICNPNNPTGSILEQSEIEQILKSTDDIVIVDEAYVEFYGKSMISQINNYDNLIVLRTFSKAFGIASARLGYLIACEKLINKLKTKLRPYNVPSISLQIGSVALDNVKSMEESVAKIVQYRKELFDDLIDLGIKAYPSHGNYILFEINDHKKIYEELLKNNIEIRYFDFGLRVTIGTNAENKAFIKKLKEIINSDATSKQKVS